MDFNAAIGAANINTPEIRERLLLRFEAWLDSVLADEEPPQGIAAEILSELESEAGGGRPSDLYSMCAAVTALTQEVKLQGRSFKELHDTLAREAERKVRKEIIEALLDLRDRLGRGLESVRAGEQEKREAFRLAWWDRLFSSRKKQIRQAIEAVAALEKGYALSLDRLDEILESYNVREIPCEGQTFDARLMSAVDVEETTAVAAGTVLEVYRAGYEWNGELYRPAQVKVASAPGYDKESKGEWDE